MALRAALAALSLALADGGWPFAESGWRLGLNGSGLSWPSDIKARRDVDGELWVTSNYDDSIVVLNVIDGEVFNSSYMKDGLGYHYMANVSSLSFGADSTFATCQDNNNNYDGITGGNMFMGPTLWNATNYASVNQFGYGNWVEGKYGSHIDMLHQSPYCRGIVHGCADDNVYYATDGRDSVGETHGSLLMYDFAQDHGPGGNDHSVARVWRYRDVQLPYVSSGVPGHLQMDCESGWLYVADTANNRVMRVEVSGGTFGADTPPWEIQMHALSEYRYVDGVRKQVVIRSSSVTAPSGLLVLPWANTIFVSEFSTGDVKAFNLATFELEGTLSQAPGAGGMEFSQGQLWLTNALQNSVWSIAVDLTTTTTMTTTDITATSTETTATTVTGTVTSISESSTVTATSTDVTATATATSATSTTPVTSTASSMTTSHTSTGTATVVTATHTTATSSTTDTATSITSSATTATTSSTATSLSGTTASETRTSATAITGSGTSATTVSATTASQTTPTQQIELSATGESQASSSIRGTVELSAAASGLTAAASAALAEVFGVSEDRVEVELQELTGRRTMARWLLSYTIRAERQQVADQSFEPEAAARALQASLADAGVAAEVVQFGAPVVHLATTTAGAAAFTTEAETSHVATRAPSPLAGAVALGACAVTAEWLR